MENLMTPYGIIGIIFNGGYFAVCIFLLYLIYELRKKHEKFEENLDTLEKEKISKDEFYRSVSGWREEINTLHRKIDDLKDLIIKERLK
jgi:hypothetical protein